MKFYVVWSILSLVPYSFGFLQDKCISLCEKEKLPALEPNTFERVVCQTGCRFFSILKFTGLDIKLAAKDCQISCNDSFGFTKERKVCAIGCHLISSNTENDVKMLVEPINEKSKKELVIGEPDTDLLESDMLMSDPSFKSQLEIGFNIDYKIPETHIRTMPIERKIYAVRVVLKDSWLECVSKTSGIPRWILALVLFGAFVVVIGIMVMSLVSIMEPKKNEDLEYGVILELSDDMSVRKTLFETACDSLLPKYSETDDNLPPKYADVVKNHEEV